MVAKIIVEIAAKLETMTMVVTVKNATMVENAAMIEIGGIMVGTNEILETWWQWLN